uniref:Putative disease resistance protein RGA3 isoform X9 n=1 Tax=Populus alba TaxID=43335 RepID=A0A4U5PNY5_POPAL|nr:putative disease resistance protein RGA3 isoform X9 [Populus alba]
MGHKIKSIIERLAEISSLKSEFNLSEQQPIDEETEMNRSFENFSGLIGRDKDKERIISLLEAPSKLDFSAKKHKMPNYSEELDLMTIEEKNEEKIQPLSLSLRIVMFDNLPSTIALPEKFLQGSAESLQTFIIRDCANIKEMPECICNLKKLQNLEISDCPTLSKKCRRGTGEDWPKIKHIPKIKVANDDSGEETSD